MQCPCSFRVRYFVGSRPCHVKPKTMKLVFTTSPLSKLNYRVRAKTGWLGTTIMCMIRATCLLVNVNCCIKSCRHHYLFTCQLRSFLGLVSQIHHIIISINTRLQSVKVGNKFNINIFPMIVYHHRHRHLIEM